MIIKTIVKKATGSIRSILFDEGDVLKEKIIPFETFIFIVHGKADVVIDGIHTKLRAGQSIVVPAHTFNSITALTGIELLSTIIKSGYEQISY